MRSYQCKGPVVWLKLPGQINTLAPYCAIIIPSQANLKSQQMPNPILQYQVQNTQIFLPGWKVYDSLYVILPGISISNRCILSICACNFPSGLTTNPVLQYLTFPSFQIYFLGIDPIAYIFPQPHTCCIVLRVAESLKSQAQSTMQSLVQGELHTQPNTEILAPFQQAVCRAFFMNVMLAYLFGMHFVCNKASLKDFRLTCIVCKSYQILSNNIRLMRQDIRLIKNQLIYDQVIIIINKHLMLIFTNNIKTPDKYYHLFYNSINILFDKYINIVYKQKWQDNIKFHTRKFIIIYLKPSKMSRPIILLTVLSLLIACSLCEPSQDQLQNQQQQISMKRTACLVLSRYHSNTQKQAIEQSINELQPEEQQKFINKMYATAVEYCMPKMTMDDAQKFFVQDASFDPRELFYYYDGFDYKNIDFSTFTKSQQAIVKFMKKFDQEMQVRREEKQAEQDTPAEEQFSIKFFGFSTSDIPSSAKYAYIGIFAAVVVGSIWYLMSKIDDGSKKSKKNKKSPVKAEKTVSEPKSPKAAKRQ